MKTFFVTTPIYYVNGKPHIGHAYTSIAADVIARHMRLSGLNVRFSTGTDEHGNKIEKTASAAKVSTKAFVDNAYLDFFNLSDLLNLSNTDFIRTTEERHKEKVKEIWNKINERGFIYLSKYTGWYSLQDEEFFSEDELIDGKAPTGADVEWIEEESYFFKLSAFQDELLKFYELNPDFVSPKSRYNEVVSFIKSGLQDLSISRVSFDWGIKVPKNNKHVIYVWLDALCNYLTATQDSSKTTALDEFWPCNLHIVGKDILRFHAIYWPAFLMAAEIPLPKKIFAHGWWKSNGRKMSKSLGNAIDPVSLISTFGVDYVRYFLMRAVRFGNDGNYSDEIFKSIINAELVNNIGNLLQRTLSLLNKYCANTIPDDAEPDIQGKNLLKRAYQNSNNVIEYLNSYDISNGISEIIELGNSCNAYIEQMAPWQLAKTDLNLMKSTLYTLLECIRIIGIMLQPFIPSLASKLLDMLKISKRMYCDLKNPIEKGTTLNQQYIIFDKIP
ncbi:MAG: methionine--tRNA ligase [Proteobacteria bacterium]|nr:methionine--tRNA ligase [Pseudomonadota bacterium]